MVVQDGADRPLHQRQPRLTSSTWKDTKNMWPEKHPNGVPAPRTTSETTERSHARMHCKYTVDLSHGQARKTSANTRDKSRETLGKQYIGHRPVASSCLGQSANLCIYAPTVELAQQPHAGATEKAETWTDPAVGQMKSHARWHPQGPQATRLAGAVLCAGKKKTASRSGGTAVAPIESFFSCLKPPILCATKRHIRLANGVSSRCRCCLARHRFFRLHTNSDQADLDLPRRRRPTGADKTMLICACRSGESRNPKRRRDASLLSIATFRLFSKSTPEKNMMRPTRHGLPNVVRKTCLLPCCKAHCL